MSAPVASPGAPVAVVVGLLVQADDRVLLCQRPPGRRYPLQWEFPGGKVEPGETAEEALVRELREELAIEAAVGGLLHSQVAWYADGGAFSVAYYLVERWRGDLRNVVFTSCQWVKFDRLLSYDILSGNREFCTRLAERGLPDL